MVKSQHAYERKNGMNMTQWKTAGIDQNNFKQTRMHLPYL